MKIKRYFKFHLSGEPMMFYLLGCGPYEMIYDSFIFATHTKNQPHLVKIQIYIVLFKCTIFQTTLTHPDLRLFLTMCEV